MGKLTIPSVDFEKELAAGQVNPAMKAAGGAAVQGALFRVPHGQLRPIEGFNVRIDTPDYLQHIADLKASIKSEGFFIDKPISGYVAKEEDGQVILITDGYSRYRAVSELIAEGVDGFDAEFQVPTIVKPTATNLEDLTVALILGNEGRPLSVYERALVAKRLVNMGVEEARIAERLEITTRYVADLLILAGASAKVRGMVIAGKVSPTEAIKQLRKSGDQAAAKLEAGVKAAAAAGKTKATAKDVKAGTPTEDPVSNALKGEEPKRGLTSKVSTRDGRVTLTMAWAYKAGDKPEFDEIRPIRLFNDGTWWNFIDEATKSHAIIEEDIVITVQVVTADPEDDTFADGTQGKTVDDAAEPTLIEDQSETTEDDVFADDETPAEPEADDEL